MERYYQPEIECASREQIREIQNEKLKKQVQHVWDNVPYYRKKMEEKGVTPADIQSVDDLCKLPFLSKADLRDAYPYGLVGMPLKDCVRIQSTSGTTGKRVVAFYTQHDIDLWEDCCARAIVAAGGTDEDVCQVSYGYGLFTGGPGLNGGSHKVGCLTVPTSSGNTERQIMFIRDLNTTILCCTPSYAAYLAETMKEMGLSPEEIPLKAGIFGAEAWSEEMRQSIQDTLGIKAYDIYGLTELSGPGVAFECSAQSGMHVNEDHFIPEIIDPETGEVLPDGTQGELVFTSLDKEAFPLLRYRTRDICVLHRGKCSCGRTFVKMGRPMGRTDDMLIIRGVNVFPSQIEAV
ncbi:MAG: phenylacetate--CoA ligase, partial [Lachnospiraceae bacterium]|nr:phenylacetate--CoA ligase [Lachnospiraceae bacterium]